MNEQTKELESKIKKVIDSVTKIFDDEKIDDFEPKLKSDLKEVNALYAKPLLEQLDNCKRLMTSPFYVGVLGRYSHGKSALVNHLFQLDDEEKLPEGDSIVTSKITRVAFNDHIKTPTAYKHFNGKEKKIEPFEYYSEFQKAAQSKDDNNLSDDDNSSIAYLSAEIPFGEKQHLAQNFFNNNIQLIDMPGLGGPYFDDSEKTIDYVEKVDLVLVAIKINEIEESADSLKKVLRQVSRPKIVVLTFYDLAAESNMYASCQGDKGKILSKAKEEVEKFFANLINTDDILVVSIKDNALVDKVRERITQKITVQNSAIAKKGQESPIVEKRRATELKRELDTLKQKAMELPKRLESLIKESVGKGKDADEKIDICSIFESAKVRTKQKRRNADIEKEVRKIKSDQMAELNSIVNVEECDAVCDRIRSKAETISKVIEETYQEYKDDLKDIANDYIDNLNVTDKQRSDFKKSVKDILEIHVVETVEFDTTGLSSNATLYKTKGTIQKNYLTITIICAILAVLFIFNGGWELGLLFAAAAFVCCLLHKNSKTTGARENAQKAKEAMKGALNDASSNFADDIFKKIDETDKKIIRSFKNEIDMSSINENVKQLKKNTGIVSDSVAALLEEVENVKYKI